MKGQKFGAVLSLSLLVAGAGSARAESALELRAPQRFGEIAALTYDVDGQRLGGARMAMRREENGRVVLEVESGIDGGARSVLRAELEPVASEKPRGQLRLVRQQAVTTDADGSPMVRMQVDHARERAVCTSAKGGAKPVALSKRDRIANVPMNLVLLPLVEGERERVRFDLLLCRGEPRVLAVEARVARRFERHGRELVEIEYRFEVAGVLSALARPFLPDVRFWFDRTRPEGWIAHRMPLYPEGPTVIVARPDVRPELLQEH